MLKKIFFIAIALLYANSASSQVCKISNANDSIEVFSTTLSDNHDFVTVTISNDSPNIVANITVTVEVTYSYNKTTRYSGKGLSRPQSTSEIKIPINPHWGNYTNYIPISAKTIEISGAKCLQ